MRKVLSVLFTFGSLAAPLLLHAQKTQVSQARHVSTEERILTLPIETAFKGTDKFHRIMAQAQREQWHRLAIGDRVARFGVALIGTPYKGFTLEIDNRIECPSVNMLGLDCWTFFEISMGMARMVETPKQRYDPIDLLREIKTTRYRQGRCSGNYLERLHYLADWYVDNDARGTIDDLTRNFGGVRFKNRRITEMTQLWKSYRYLKHNPSLRPGMAQHEKRVARLPVTYIPKARVAAIEPKLRSGDVIGIATNHHGGFCSHVGLAYKHRDGSMRLMHASSDAKKVIIDAPIHKYLHRYSKNAGILVGRPLPKVKATTRRKR